MKWKKVSKNFLSSIKRQMPFTSLNTIEKLRSLLYIAKNEFSSDENIKSKQFKVLDFFFENYIKECDYFPFVRCIDSDQGTVYTLAWEGYLGKLTEKTCEELKKNIESRNKKYIAAIKAITDELAKIQHPIGSRVGKFATLSTSLC